MHRAVAKARESLGFSWLLCRRKAGYGELEVKSVSSTADKVEHIWIRDVIWDGKAFHGRVDHEALAFQTPIFPGALR